MFNGTDQITRRDCLQSGLNRHLSSNHSASLFIGWIIARKFSHITLNNLFEVVDHIIISQGFSGLIIVHWSVFGWFFILGNQIVIFSIRFLSVWEFKLVENIVSLDILLFVFNSLYFFFFWHSSPQLLIYGKFLFATQSVDNLSLNFVWQKSKYLLINYPDLDLSRVCNDRQISLHVLTTFYIDLLFLFFKFHRLSLRNLGI